MTRFSPMPLQERRQPSSHPDWLYEVKHDGFRALAVIKDGRCRLLSRNGNHLKRFASLEAALAAELRATEAVPDGEIVCLDPKDGRSIFADLFEDRTEPHFYAFDLLSLEGLDLRSVPLVQRKIRLKALMPDLPSRVLYVDHVEQQGAAFFRVCFEWDLEGMVAKRKDGVYQDDRRRSTWVKVKNPTYSQKDGRFDWLEAYGRK